MSGPDDDLYFGPIKVGGVTRSGMDFPNLCGTFTFDPGLSHATLEEAARLRRFVTLSQESTRLGELETERDTTPEQTAIDAELEAIFIDFVESEDWRLVDARGHEELILCPIFRHDGEIVWRWF